MDFMENMKNVVADTAQTVAKKTGELIESSKIKYAIFDLKTDIKKLFSQIGETYYKNQKNGVQEEETLQELCDLIEAKYAKIETLTAKLEDVKNEAKCPTCGRICDAELNYCPFCGAEMAVKVEPDVVVAEVKTDADAAGADTTIVDVEIKTETEEKNSGAEE